MKKQMPLRHTAEANQLLPLKSLRKKKKKKNIKLVEMDMLEKKKRVLKKVDKPDKVNKAPREAKKELKRQISTTQLISAQELTSSLFLLPSLSLSLNPVDYPNPQASEALTTLLLHPNLDSLNHNPPMQCLLNPNSRTLPLPLLLLPNPDAVVETGSPNKEAFALPSATTLVLLHHPHPDLLADLLAQLLVFHHSPPALLPAQLQLLPAVLVLLLFPLFLHFNFHLSAEEERSGKYFLGALFI